MTRLRTTGLLAVVLAACAEDDGLALPPLEFESERARIGIDDDESTPLCGADLAHIDRRVAFIEEHLNVRRDDPVEIYILDFDALPCGSDSYACYSNEHDQIYTTWDSLDHELVHAVTREIAYPSLFWDEGAAELLSGKTTRKDTRIVLTPEALDAQELTTYLSAAHFSRFLVETRGWEAYGRIVRGEPFDAVFGESAAALTEEYEREAPFAYPPIDPCPFPRLRQVDDGSWRESFDIACDSPDATQFETVTYSSSRGAAIVRSVELEAGTYAFELTGGSSFIALGCHTSELSEAPIPPSNGDLLNEVDYASGTEFPMAGVHLLELTDGVYRISISAGQSALTAPVAADLSVTRVE